MPIIFDQLRGLADSKHSGIAGSVAALVGVDIHSTPGLTKINQKLTKDSATTITALCRVAVAISNGMTIWFSYTDGKIWSRTTAGVWTLVWTTTPAAGNAECLGASEFNGRLYWATQSRLHYIAVGATMDTAAYWTTNATEDTATFTKTDSEFHPMVIQSGKLFIGDGNQVAKVTSAFAFTASALDIIAPNRIKTMEKFDIDIIYGTFIHANVNHCEVGRWDTVSTSWTVSDPIDENGVNAFIRDDNFVYAQCGTFGRIYFYDGSQLVSFTRIPGTWSPTSYGEIFPGSVATHLTMPVFGLSNGSGNPALQGVYRFGSYSKNYPKVMDLSFPISNSSTLQTLSIGAILAVGADLFVSWQDGSTYGVDKLDWSNKYASAYIETMVLTASGERSELKTVLKIFANYHSLPTSTDISFKYKIIHETSFSSAVTVLTDAQRMQKRAEITINDAAALQLRLDFTVSSNNAPEIESVGFEDNLPRRT